MTNTEGTQSFARFTQVRSSQSKGAKRNKVYTRGYASTPEKFDVWMHQKNKDGTVKEFKSLFTDRCLQDLEKQLFTKSIFVDGMHELAVNDGVLRLLREKGVKEDSEDYLTAKEMLKMKELPLAKVTGFKLDNTGLMIETETNPHFADVDDDHGKYYDAVCNSLLDEYLQGYSINFQPSEYTTETDTEGNEVTMFDKLNVYGISYATNLPLADNSFTEVCMRMAREGFRMGENRMNKGNEQVGAPVQAQPIKEETITPAPAQPTAVAPAPTATEPVSDRDQLREEVKAELIKEQQQDDMKKQVDGMRRELDELRTKKAESEPNQGAKGVVTHNQDKYASKVNGDANTNDNTPADQLDFDVTKRDAWQGKLKEVTKGFHDWYDDISRPTTDSDPIGMRQSYRGSPQEGFGELIQLQGAMQTHKLRKPGEDDSTYNTRMRYMEQSPSDDMVLKRIRNE